MKTSPGNHRVDSSNQSREEFMKKLQIHAKRAESFSSAKLKQRVAVPSPQGGYRMEVRDIK